MFRTVGNWDVTRPDWWRYPLERNAFKRNVITGDLNSLFALADTELLWAVGDGGFIVHSNDGGRTWRQQGSLAAPAPAVGASLAHWLSPIATAQAAVQDQTPQPSTPAVMPSNVADYPASTARDAGTKDSSPVAGKTKADSPAQVEQKRQPIAAGEKSRTEPSPNQTEQSVAPVTPVQTPLPANGPIQKSVVPVAMRRDWAATDLRSVFFVDGQRGWAAGDYGTLIATTDGGVTWTPQNSGTENWLRSIRFLADGRRGWAARCWRRPMAAPPGFGR